MPSFGLTIPQRGALFGVAPLPELLALSTAAEETGLFDTVWIGDSLTSKARAEALTCLGALAGMTSRVRLAVGCLASFPLRDPALFAYQWASLDEISKGRMLLAVCNGLQKRDGASEKEGRHFGGVPDKERVRRLEEYMDLIRELWTGEPVTHHGRVAHYDDIQILPVPVQKNAPVWISANPPTGPVAERVYRRVATKADGLLTTQVRPGYVRDTRDQLEPLLVEAGKDPAAFPIAAYHSVNIGPDADACLAESMRFFDNYYGEGAFGPAGAAAMTAHGSPEQCAEQLQAVLDEGANHITIRLSSWSQREQFDLLVNKVLPRLG